MNKTKAQIFGLFLANHRKEKKLSLENIAQLTHCSVSAIRNYENGIQLPEFAQQNKIAQLFGYEKFFDNFNSLHIYRNILKKIETLMYHRKKKEALELLENIHQNSSRWKASYAYMQYYLICLMEIRYNFKTKEQFNQLIGMLDSGNFLFTDYEKYIFYEFQGDFYFQKNDLYTATIMRKKAYDINPRSFLVNLHLAMQYQSLEYQSLSLNHLEYAKKLVFKQPDMYRFLQICMLELSYQIEETESYDSIFESRYDLYNACLDACELDLSYEVLSNISYMYLQNKDYINSISFGKKIIELNPIPYVNAIWFVPYSYWKIGFYKECNNTIKKVEKAVTSKSYIGLMLKAVEMFCLKKRKIGIEILKGIIEELDQSEDMEKKIFILEWLIEEMIVDQNYEQAHIYEAEKNRIINRRTSLFFEKDRR